MTEPELSETVEGANEIETAEPLCGSGSGIGNCRRVEVESGE